jgi:hypothetical protein
VTKHWFEPFGHVWLRMVKAEARVAQLEAELAKANAWARVYFDELEALKAEYKLMSSYTLTNELVSKEEAK